MPACNLLFGADNPQPLPSLRIQSAISCNNEGVAGQARNDGVMFFWIASPYRVRNDVVAKHTLSTVNYQLNNY